jgi:DNA polymerase II large subunit
MNIDEYEDLLDSRLSKSLDIANDAKKDSNDPSESVEIEVAEDIAGRSEKLLNVEGLAKEIRSIDDELDREKVALKIAKKIGKGEIGNFESKRERIENAVRVAVALLTESIVAAPIEGIGEIELEKNPDGSEFVRIPFHGPIRSAGGTAQALAVLVADYVRQEVGVGEYKPYDSEIERYTEEVRLYGDDKGLQYTPKDKETKLIIEECPIMIDGGALPDLEVEGNRNLERIKTNGVREGMCLVVAEGIALKAPKIKRYTDDLDISGWSWLDKLIKEDSSEEKSEDEENNNKNKSFDKNRPIEGWENIVKPSKKYMQDIVGGRPSISGPSKRGGLRLRYGRTRNIGLAACGIHPATMAVCDDLIANGTQIKTERPGKAAGVSVVDSIEGPMVKLKNGEVKRINTEEEAKEKRNGIDKIIDMGEILIPYGEFVENNHPLPPSSYVHEWWIKEYNKNGGEKGINPKKLDFEEAFQISKEYEIPLHPKFTLTWHDIEKNEYNKLCALIKRSEKENNNLHISIKSREILEKLLVPYIEKEDKIIVEYPYSEILAKSTSTKIREGDVIEQVSKAMGIEVREKAPTRIGARVGRPEKSKSREMSPPVNSLFPIGNAGGAQRDVKKATNYYNEYYDELSQGDVKVQMSSKLCLDCESTTWKSKCENCGSRTIDIKICRECDKESSKDSEKCSKCGEDSLEYYSRRIMNVDKEYELAKENLGNIRPSNMSSKVKGVKGLSSEKKIPEPLEKGMLRAKYDIQVFRDGTSRYDMSDLPLTHFKPEEIGASVEKIRELGYEKDINGEKLEKEEQLLEIYPQDIILNRDCAKYLLKVAKFIDDLLQDYYNKEPCYNANSIEDLIGELGIGLAPHTSGGTLCRIIGFTDAKVNYASPFYHAAKRRNCDGDEDCVMLLMDGLLNFSFDYLPEFRGGRMDAPLVLTKILDGEEVDDEAHNVETVEEYPLEFYNKTMSVPDPDEADIDIGETIVEDAMGFNFTKSTTNINKGVNTNAYKKIGSMEEKTENQMNICRKAVSVDEDVIAEKLIKTHYLPDILGNIKAFATQDFRCTNCNDKYQRPPLTGKCGSCNKELILTVHEGSVRKYLEIVGKLAEKYDISNYTKQRVDLLDNRVDSIFISDSERQSGLEEFM